MSNELKTGLTVVLAIFFAFLGFRFLSDSPLFGPGMEVVSTFDRVDGLGTGGVVTMSGVKIGSVKQINLRPDHRVEVVMSIETDVQIPEDSKAHLTAYGILDGKSIMIERGRSDRPVARGGEIEGIYMDSIMESLAERGHELGDDISASFNELNRFLLQLNRSLDDEASESINRTIHRIEESATTLSHLLTSRQRELQETIASVNRMMAQLDTTVTTSRPQVERLLENLEISSGEIRKASGELDQTVDQLNRILVKINNGEGTIGRMVNDPSLYENVDSLSVELRALIRGINENPGRYLRHMNLIEIF